MLTNPPAWLPLIVHGSVERHVDVGCPVSRDLVHVSLELDQSMRVSHLIWSTRRLRPLRRLT